MRRWRAWRRRQRPAIAAPASAEARERAARRQAFREAAMLVEAAALSYSDDALREREAGVCRVMSVAAATARGLALAIRQRAGRDDS